MRSGEVETHRHGGQKRLGLAVIAQQQFAQRPADRASTTSLIVTPSALPVSLMSANAKVAVANLRSGVSMWLMNVGGGVNGRVNWGESLRLLRRTLPTPSAV